MLQSQRAAPSFQYPHVDGLGLGELILFEIQQGQIAEGVQRVGVALTERGAPNLHHPGEERFGVAEFALVPIRSCQ